MPISPAEHCLVGAQAAHMQSSCGEAGKPLVLRSSKLVALIAAPAFDGLVEPQSARIKGARHGGLELAGRRISLPIAAVAPAGNGLVETKSAGMAPVAY